MEMAGTAPHGPRLSAGGSARLSRHCLSRHSRPL